MFTDYSPRPLHFFLPALFFIAGAVTMIHSAGLGLAFWWLGLLASLWIFFIGIWQARSAYNSTLSDVAREVRLMNPEQYDALGIHFPELRIHYHGKPVSYLEDTSVRMEHFKKFLEDSDEVQFAPERLYGDGTQMRRQWTLCRDWLIEMDFLIQNSAAGNHSWLWRTGRRSQLFSMYFSQPLELIDLNELETI